MEFEEKKTSTQFIESIYTQGKMDYQEVKENPILKPVMQYNSSYMNNELLINRALYEYEQAYNGIKKLIQDNPKYSETIIVAQIQKLLIYVSQIIHLQDIERADLLKIIREMISIAKKEYGILDEPVPDTPEMEIEETVPIKETPLTPPQELEVTPEEVKNYKETETKKMIVDGEEFTAIE